MIAGNPCLRPENTEELAEILRAGHQIRTSGAGRHADFALPDPNESGPPTPLGCGRSRTLFVSEPASARIDNESAQPANTLKVSIRKIDGVVAHYATDQVVVVRAGTTIEELQAALAPSGQCVPLGDGVLPQLTNDSTLGGLISMNLPHTREAQCGTWRDWVLGMTVVQADGTIAKGGSLAVKNVAGYDVQKLFVGARGALGVIVELILRTFPIKALPATDVLKGGAWTHGPIWVQRVLPSDFARASETDRLMWADRASSTIVCSVTADLELPRFPHDWVVRSGCGAKNLQFTDVTHIRLMRRAKELLDPEARLNSGVLGDI